MSLLLPPSPLGYQEVSHTKQRGVQYFKSLSIGNRIFQKGLFSAALTSVTDSEAKAVNTKMSCQVTLICIISIEYQYVYGIMKMKKWHIMYFVDHFCHINLGTVEIFILTIFNTNFDG